MTLGGRRVDVRRPRMRSADDECELSVQSYEYFADRDPLTRAVMDRMLTGVSTRRFAGVGEPVGAEVERSSSSTSKTSVSEMFIARTRTALSELMSRLLHDVRLAVMMLDGIEIAGRTHVVALGISTEGVKIPLGLWEGSTENATLACTLLADLVDRGLDPEQAILFVIDGSKALRKAIKDVFGEHALVQRCHRHKERNVTELLPERDRPAIRTRMRAAWALSDRELAHQRLELLASELDQSWPDAAASLREGMEDTLTLMGLGITGQPSKTLCSTNPWRLETLRRDLPWLYAVRDIMAEGSPSKVLLKYSGADPEPLIGVLPHAEVVFDREDEVPDYPGHRYRFTLYRASEPLEARPYPRLRRSGILIKGGRGIHGCDFLASELERDPAADRFFGRLECEGISTMAEEWDARRAEGASHPADNPTFILDPNRRGGLAEDHPFVRALYQGPAIRFMREKLEDLGAPAPGDVVNDKAFHKSGVGVSPVFTQIPVGATKSFIVKADNEKLDLPAGTSLEVALSKAARSAVQIVGTPAPMEADPIDGRRLQGSFTLRGLAEHRRVQVGCKVDGLEPVFAELQVIPAEPVDREIPGDFAFHRKGYTVKQGARRTLLLRGRFGSPTPAAPTVRLDDGTVAVFRERGQFELVPGTTYYEAAFVVEGRQPKGKTTVVAAADGRVARCDLRVVDKDEEGVDLTFRLVDHDLGMNFRASWDRHEPNTLLITTKHEATSRYLGAAKEGYPGQSGPAFRVLLAELISDNVCRRIVEAHARAQPDAFDSDKTYLLHNRLMKEFTPIAHRIQLAAP